MTLVLALDIATVTGFARGELEPRCTGCGTTLSMHEIRARAPGALACCPERDMQIAAPASGSVRFGAPGASESAIFARCLTWLSAFLEPQPRPDLLVLEAMLPGNAKVGATATHVRDRLAGLQAIVRAVAHLRGVYRIDTHAVGDVRHHFIGSRMMKRDAAKRATIERCDQLGWHVEDDNAADACALWSYAVALIRPEQALKLSPLFNKALQHRSIDDGNRERNEIARPLRSDQRQDEDLQAAPAADDVSGH